MPRQRYDAALADDIETKWQAAWKASGTYHTPNPAGSLTEGPANGPADLASRPKLFIMDMFPYPSGSGLHVGHPLGYISTDVYARFKRMTGHNVLHTMGYDAFGLPAEEHARQTGVHPRENTEANIANMSRQLARLGLGHDDRRSIATTDEAYYRWTQWIFNQIFNSWFDPDQQKARPISELEAEFADGSRPTPDGRPWAELSTSGQRATLHEYRLAYVSEAPVNWCPGLGTVLANEEVTAEGRSDRGNFPVFRRPLKQWMMRITAYADRLLDDLDLLDWTDSIKTMQRNWIGRSEGAHVDFRVPTAANDAGEVATISDWDGSGGAGEGRAYTGEGPAINSGFLDGMSIADAKTAMIDHLEETRAGEGTVTTKLRDWLFARQRYWGEPIPIVFDADGNPLSVPDSELPVNLPELIDWAPRQLDEDSEPEPPLGRATEWTGVELDLGEGPETFKRDLNVMPQWAGSCWYYLRYIDPLSDDTVADPTSETYWMGGADADAGGVDLYVGGVEHAVLHLLYSRFWHKVLYDLGHVSTKEPFKRLINQGYIQAYAFKDDRGIYVEAADVAETADGYEFDGQAVTREYGKMGKSLKNAVTPDDMYEQYGADTLRLYEMFMGPIDQDRPWETKSVVGSQRLLQRIWRNLVDEDSGELTVSDDSASDELRRVLHRTIDAVRTDMDALSFNTSIARITELNNELTKLDGPTPREVADPLVRMIAPLVPHVAEELWQRLGNDTSVVYADFPTADPALLVDDEIEIPVQIKGKVRSRITVAADADDATLEAAALADERIQELLGGAEIRKVIVVSGRLVNIIA